MQGVGHRQCKHGAASLAKHVIFAVFEITESRRLVSTSSTKQELAIR